MLEVNREITLIGSSKIGDEIAENYRATIMSGNPEDMTFSSFQIDKALYKENRTTCREDRAAFEEKAYALQDEMIAKLKEATDSAETETGTEEE